MTVKVLFFSLSQLEPEDKFGKFMQVLACKLDEEEEARRMIEEQLYDIQNKALHKRVNHKLRELKKFKSAQHKSPRWVERKAAKIHMQAEALKSDIERRRAESKALHARRKLQFSDLEKKLQFASTDSISRSGRRSRTASQMGGKSVAADPPGALQSGTSSEEQIQFSMLAAANAKGPVKPQHVPGLSIATVTSSSSQAPQKSPVGSDSSAGGNNINISLDASGSSNNSLGENLQDLERQIEEKKKTMRKQQDALDSPEDLVYKSMFIKLNRNCLMDSIVILLSSYRAVVGFRR